MTVLVNYRSTVLSENANYHNSVVVDWNPGPIGGDRGRTFLFELGRSVYSELHRSLDLPSIDVDSRASHGAAPFLEVLYSIEALIKAGWIIVPAPEAIILSENDSPSALTVIFPHSDLVRHMPNPYEIANLDRRPLAKDASREGSPTLALMGSSIGEYFSLMHVLCSASADARTHSPKYLFFHQRGDASNDRGPMTLDFFTEATCLNAGNPYGISPLLDGSRYLMQDKRPAYRLFMSPDGSLQIQSAFADRSVDTVQWYQKFAGEVSRLLRSIDNPGINELNYVSEKLISAPLLHISKLNGIPDELVAKFIATFEYDLEFFKEWVARSKG